MGPFTPLVGALGAGLLVLAAAVQVGVACGATWGGFVYGGRLAEEGEALPLRWRILSAFSAVLLLAFAVPLLDASHWIDTGLSPWIVDACCWVIALVMGLNTVSNLSGHHWIENRLFATMTVLITSCAASVVLI